MDPLRAVVGREQKGNYTVDTLECGHTLADHDNRRPTRRRCWRCAWEKGRKLNIYVGATFSRYEEARAIMDALTNAGHTITHDWTRTRAFGDDGHPLPGSAGGYDLDPEDGAAHARDDVEAVKRADALLMLASEPSCGWPIETGIGIACDKRIAIVDPFKYTVFWDLPNVVVFEAVDEALVDFGVDVELARMEGAP